MKKYLTWREAKKLTGISQGRLTRIFHKLCIRPKKYFYITGRIKPQDKYHIDDIRIAIEYNENNHWR